MVELLITKDKEFRSILKLAAEQEKIEEKMTTVKAQVDLQVCEYYQNDANSQYIFNVFNPLYVRTKKSIDCSVT